MKPTDGVAIPRINFPADARSKSLIAHRSNRGTRTPNTKHQTPVLSARPCRRLRHERQTAQGQVWLESEMIAQRGGQPAAHAAGDEQQVWPVAGFDKLVRQFPN